MIIDHLLTLWPLLIIYTVCLVLLAIVLAYVERRRVVKRMHLLRHPEKLRTITIMGQQVSYYPPPPPPPPTRFVNDSVKPSSA